ncbi:Na+/H+ antiporter NhaA [Rhodococcus sp. NPDC060084]|uniref:Na+/H+ antiporter NhaA n=1 Tax=Rhodococcus sp. NPDC060084 TaxID=3347053 RepID=UPI003652A32A
MTVDDNPTNLRRVSRLLAGIRDGTDDDTLAAGFLLAATVVALVWANLGDSYEAFWHTPLSIRIGDYAITLDLKDWVNDGLMTLFFFVVGLEVKRELTIGELTDRTRAAVPLVAAVAGLALPAVLYLLLNPSGEAAGAWGVVVSTDTAFVLGALALVGPRCPARLRVFILALAVADDIGALAIIGFFYTEQLRLGYLLLGFAGLLLIMQFRRLEVWRGVAYFLVAAATWVAFYESGVHPTLAGVLIALILPIYPPRRAEVERAGQLTRAFRQSPNPDYARAAQLGVLRAVSVNERLLRFYQPYTAFLVVPIFALANAGVVITGETIGDAIVSPITWGVVLGLVVGKLVGITAAEASEAAAAQGKFWEMHDLLFAHSDALSEEEIYDYAERLGLDMDRFDEDLRLDRYRHRVDDDDLDAATSNLSGTPTFYLGATGTGLPLHTGPFDAATLISRLEEAREV